MRQRRISAFKKYDELPPETSPLFKKNLDLSDIPWNQYQLKRAVPNPTKPLMPQPANAIILDWPTALKKHEKTVRTTLKTLYLHEPENAFTALNDAVFQNGYVVIIPDNTQLETPIYLPAYVKGTNGIQGVQNLIIAGKKSRSTLIQETVNQLPIGKGTCFLSMTRIVAQENAHVNEGTLSALNSQTVSFTHKMAVAGPRAQLALANGLFGGKTSMSRTEIMLLGERSHVLDAELSFSDGNQRTNSTANLHFKGFNATGKIVHKSIFTDHAKGVFKGIISIPEKAFGSSAYLSSHSVLLSPYAQADTIPALEIKNNNVKATHAASVARLNDETLFYIMSRGIRLEAAKKMVVQGFMEPVLRQIQVPEVRQHVRQFIARKMDGESIENAKPTCVSYLKEIPVNAPAPPQFERHYKYR